MFEEVDTTNCELCSKEIETDDVRNCDDCGLDGLCKDCYESHECED